VETLGVIGNISRDQAGLHPALISAEANIPEMPNVPADSTASATPATPGPVVAVRTHTRRDYGAHTAFRGGGAFREGR
jgi:hypothetical protein